MKIIHWPKGKNSTRFSLWHIETDTPGGKLCGGFTGEFFNQKITLEVEPEQFLEGRFLPETYLPKEINAESLGYYERWNWLGICLKCQWKYKALIAPPPPVQPKHRKEKPLAQTRLENLGQGRLF